MLHFAQLRPVNQNLLLVLLPLEVSSEPQVVHEFSLPTAQQPDFENLLVAVPKFLK